MLFWELKKLKELKELKTNVSRNVFILWLVNVKVIVPSPFIPNRGITGGFS